MWNALKNQIIDSIAPNGNNEITGQLLQDVLLDIVDELGSHYGLMGVATPMTDPGVQNGNVAYLATTIGVYTNLGGVEITNAGLYLITKTETIWEVVFLIGDSSSVLALKADLVGGKVPSAQLPSYVDDVVEVANFVALPIIGETGKIYVTIDTNYTYRWTGTIYVSITNPLSYASQPDAESNTENSKVITALRTFQNWINNVKTYAITELNTTAKTIVDSINELLIYLNLKQAVNVGICESCPILSTDVIRDHTTRTLTIATIKGGEIISASNPIRFFTSLNKIRSKWEKSTSQSVTWTDTRGLKYIYFDNDGVLKSSDTPWVISDLALVWRLYWNPLLSGSARIVREAIEMHPNTISSQDHQWKHRFGAIWMSGFDIVCNILASGAPNASGLNTCLSFTGGSVMDDNLQYTVLNSTTPADFSQDLGITTAASITTANAGVMDITYNDILGALTVIAGTRIPFMFNQSTNIPQVISAGGIFTDVLNNNFFKYYIYSFQDPRFGKVISLRSGGQYATKAEADAETWESIKAASPTLQDGEVKQLYETTWEYRSSYNISVKKAALRGYKDLRSNASISVSTGGSSGAIIASNVITTPTATLLSTDQASTNAELGARTWIEDLTAWVGTETTLTLTSNKFRDFGTVSVTTAVTVTLTAVTSPQLAHYGFKFKFGTGGSFTFTGVHLAAGNPTLTNGKYYEASIIRGELIYKEVA